MAYRRILVPLKGGAADAHALKAAFDVAQAFSGHVAGVYVKPNPTLVLRYLGSGVSARVVQEIVEAAEDEAERAAGVARSALMQAAKAADAPVQPQARAGAGLGASFRVGENPIEHEDPIEGVIAEEARLSDLCVFESPVDKELLLVTKDFPFNLVEEFWKSAAFRGKFNLHVDVIRARNGHHAAEAVFKSAARALAAACALTGTGVLSTKGTLTA